MAPGSTSRAASRPATSSPGASSTSKNFAAIPRRPSGSGPVSGWSPLSNSTLPRGWSIRNDGTGTRSRPVSPLRNPPACPVSQPHVIANRRTAIALPAVLQLDQELAEARPAPVDGPLGAAALDVHGLARRHRVAERRAVGTVGVDGRPLEYAEDVVHRVPVEIGRLPRLEPHLPDLHALVLEQQPRGDVAEPGCIGHGRGE